MIVKLATNVPLTGIVEKVGYWPGKKGWVDPKDGKSKDLPDRISLSGKWDVGEGPVYLDLWAVDPLIGLGLIEEGPQEYGHPGYRVVSRRTLCILKSEKEGNRKETTFSWADGAPSIPSQVVASPTTVRSTSAPTNPAQVMTGTSPVVRPGPQVKDSDWISLTERYENCVGIVEATYQNLGPGIDLMALSPDAFVAAVATVFIAASRENL